MRHGRALDGGGRGEAPLGGPRGPRRGKRRGARYPKGFKFSSAAAARADRVHVAPRARARGQDMPHELYPLTVPRDTIPRRAPQRFRAAAMNIRKHGFFFLVVVGGLGVLVGVGGGGDGAATSDSFTHRGAWAVTFVGTQQLLSRELAPRHQFWWLYEILVFHPKRETAPGWLVTNPRFQKKKKDFLKKKEPRPGRLKRGPAPVGVVGDRRFAA